MCAENASFRNGHGGGSFKCQSHTVCKSVHLWVNIGEFMSQSEPLSCTSSLPTLHLGNNGKHGSGFGASGRVEMCHCLRQLLPAVSCS